MLPVTIVIPTWNAADEIRACLAAAASQECEQVIVVDNASRDATIAIVSREFPLVRVIANATNNGFAGACNQGFTASTSEAVIFLNSDARLEPAYVEILWERLRNDQKAATATGKLVFEQDGTRRIDSAGIVLNRWRLSPEDRGFGEVDNGQYDRDELIFGPSAAAALYRTMALREVSRSGQCPFDENLFAYYEDVDLAWRLNRAGWTHWYLPSAVGWHHRRGPGSKPREIRARAFANRYTVWRKNERAWRFVTYAPIAVPWEVARLAKIAVRSPRDLRDFTVAGARALFGRRPG